MNTSDVYDEAMKLLRKKKFFEQKQRGWEPCLSYGGLNGLKLECIEGLKGIKDEWQELCEWRIQNDIGMVVRLSDDRS